MKELIPVDRIAQKIYVIRGQKVMLDSDLAEFYGVKTKVLNQSVKRNVERFPSGFMFQLDQEENNRLRSQIVTSKSIEMYERKGSGGRQYLPYVFTEHGVLMLSSVLNSKESIQVSIVIVTAFIKMREYLSENSKIIEKLQKHDENFVIVFKVLKQLTDKPKIQVKEKKYGFKA